MLSTCTAIVERFALLLVRECPGLELEDIRGELWVEVVKAKDYWQEDGGAKFTTILYQRLQWAVNKLKQKWVNSIKMHEAEFAFAHHQSLYTLEVDHEETSFDTLCGEVRSRLREDDRAVLELMVNPPPAFLTFVQKCWRERASRGAVPQRSNTVQQVHYARFLDSTELKVSRAVARIGRTIQEIIHDTEE